MSERRGTRGILNPVAGLQRFRLNRFEPCAALAPFVDWYWVVRWDLPEEAAPFEQEVLPHPCVNLAIEARGSAIHGSSPVARWPNFLGADAWWQQSSSPAVSSPSSGYR